MKNRVKELIGHEAVVSFARRCGISEGGVRKYLDGASPSTANLVTMADAGNVNIEWLAAGRGPKQRGQTLIIPVEAHRAAAIPGACTAALPPAPAYVSYTATPTEPGARPLLPGQPPSRFATAEERRQPLPPSELLTQLGTLIESAPDGAIETIVALLTTLARTPAARASSIAALSTVMQPDPLQKAATPQQSSTPSTQPKRQANG